MIPLSQCAWRGVYEVHGRNLEGVAVYTGNETFIGIREKHGGRYLTEEFHYELATFGTVVPVRQVGTLPAHIAVSSEDDNTDLFEFIDTFKL